VFSKKAPDDVEVSTGDVTAGKMDCWRTGIRRLQHRFGFRDDTDDGDAEDLLHILVRQHLAFVDTFRRVAGDQQVLLDWLATEQRTP